MNSTATFTPRAFGMKTATEEYTRSGTAQLRPFGTALVALSALAGHVETGRVRGAIHGHYADQLIVELEALGYALNQLAQRPRKAPRSS